MPIAHSFVAEYRREFEIPDVEAEIKKLLRRIDIQNAQLRLKITMRTARQPHKRNAINRDIKRRRVTIQLMHALLVLEYAELARLRIPP